MCARSTHAYPSCCVASGWVRPDCAGREDVGVYLAELRQLPLLSAEEEYQYAQRCRSGEQAARSLLIRHNLRLVVSIARRYRTAGLSFADLIAEGNLGLIRAVDKFDPQRGHRFVTYAAWWVRQAVDQAASQQRTVVHRPRRLLLQRRREQRLLQACQQGEGASVAGFRLTACGADQPLDAAEAGLCSGLLTVAPGARAAHFSPCRQLEHEQLLHKLHEWLACMPAQQARILRDYFGLDHQPRQTLLQIAEQLQLSRQQVISLRNRALVSLREAFLRHQLDAASLLCDRDC